MRTGKTQNALCSTLREHNAFYALYKQKVQAASDFSQLILKLLKLLKNA
jgi:hypothetical protein